MANAWTVDNLIRRMRTRGYLPASLGLTTQQILDTFTDEAGLYVVSMLKSIREEFLVAEADLAATSGDLLAIPARAAGAALRSLSWLVSGVATPLDRIEPERRHLYDATGTPAGYIFHGDSVELVPASSGTVRVKYQQRPGLFVLEASCGLISDVTSGVVTVDAFPSDFAATEAYDFVRGTANYGTRAIDVEPTAVDSGARTLTFATADIPSGLAAGDFVCLAGETCLPPFPSELHQLLALRSALAIAQGSGSSRVRDLKTELEGEDGRGGMRKDVIALLTPRNDASARPIIRTGGPARGWW